MAYHVLITRSAAAANAPIILNPRNPAYCKDTAPASITLARVEYLRKKMLVNKSRKEQSKCWVYGEKLLRVSDKKAFYYCYDCEDNKTTQELLALDGTTTARNHMRVSHCRNPDTGLIITSEEVPKDTYFSVVQQWNLDVFKALLIRWFVVCQLAFFMLENDSFRKLVCYLSASLGALLPKAASTLRRWIMAEYNERKLVLKAELEASISQIHLSFDIWTAGNWLAIISVWAYWIDDTGERQRRLLAFRRIYRSHDGDNQAEILLEVLYEYNITHNVGYFVSDNHGANDGAVSIVLKSLKPGISAAEQKERRLRCFGHILNLSARSLLDPSSREFTAAAEELDIDTTTNWQPSGSLGKLHNLVKYILASPQRREEFGELKGGRTAKDFDHLGLLMDNTTRWNSVHRMLDRAIDVKERLIKFVRQHEPNSQSEYQPQKERLLAKDWVYINRLRMALKAFEDATLETQGYRPWLSDWFITLHLLMDRIYDWQVDAQEVQGDNHLALCFSTSWRKLEKYYTLVDDTPVYYAAILLNPTQKTQKLRELWRQDNQRLWIEPTIEKVRSLWRRQYKPAARATTTVTHHRLVDEDDSFSSLLYAAKRRRLDDTAIKEDAFEAYLATDPEPFDCNDKERHFDVIGWWQKRQTLFPSLAQMAFDIFSIPLMSDNNERSFSSGRDMITYRRTRLQSDIIEACQCLKSWYGVNDDEFDDEDKIEKDLATVDVDNMSK